MSAVDNETIVRLVEEECKFSYILQVEDSYARFRLANFIFSLLFFTVCYRLVYKHRKTYRINVRTKYSYIFFAMYFIGIETFGIIDGFSGTENFTNSCAFFKFVLYTPTAAMFSFLGFKLLLYYKTYKLYRNIISQTQDVIGSRRKASLSSKGTPAANTRQVTGKSSRRKKTFRHTSFYAKKLFWKLFFAGNLLTVIWIFLSCPIWLDVTCKQGDVSLPEVFLLFMLFVLGFSICLIFCLTYSFNDPFRVLSEVRVMFIGYIVTVLVLITFQRIEKYVPGKSDFKELDFNPYFLLSLINYLLLLYVTVYQVYQARKQSSIKPDLSLRQILENENASKLFRFHLVTESSQENYLLWKAIQKWKDLFETTDSEVSRVMANNIKRRFIGDESETPVNISGKCVIAFDKNLKQPSLKITLFDEVEREIYDVMVDDAFLRFRTGPLYSLIVGLSFGKSEQLTVEDML